MATKVHVQVVLDAESPSHWRSEEVLELLPQNLSRLHLQHYDHLDRRELLVVSGIEIPSIVTQWDS